MRDNKDNKYYVIIYGNNVIKLVNKYMKKEKEGTNLETNEIQPSKMREIIIRTDGNSINLHKAEVSGKIELIGILTTLIDFINTQK